MPKRASRKSRKSARRSHNVEVDHTVGELFLHGLSSVVGLGILIIPLFLVIIYGVLSVYIAAAAGFIALWIALLIYDVSITHSHDPYNFLKATSGREYAFIFGFLLLISLIITTTVAGVASVGELSLFFNINVYSAIGIVDVVFVIIWAVMFYGKIRKAMNFSGMLKIAFLILLIIVGSVIIGMHGVNVLPSALTTLYTSISSTALSSSSLIVLAILLMLWAYGGFESVSIVYKGEDRTKVAKSIMYVIATAIILFTIVQVLVYANSGNWSLSASPVLAFTANILSAGAGGITADVVVGLSIVVILLVAMSVIKVSNETIEKMSLDNIMPRGLAGNENLKLLISAAIPIVILTVFSPFIVSATSAPFIYLIVIGLSVLPFVAAFLFFAAGYSYHYAKQRDNRRVVLGFLLVLLLLSIIFLVPFAFLVGLAIIMIITIVGYAIIR